MKPGQCEGFLPRNLYTRQLAVECPSLHVESYIAASYGRQDDLSAVAEMVGGAQLGLSGRHN